MSQGQAGSLVQLRPCTGSAKQTWSYESSDGSFRSKLGTASSPLCLANPKRPPQEKLDKTSIVADPMFVDAAAGNFNLDPSSPAISELGFEPIPPIEAPKAICGSTSSEKATSCLAIALQEASVTDAATRSRRIKTDDRTGVPSHTFMSASGELKSGPILPPFPVAKTRWLESVAQE